jgi:antibiotic biosynthesis monooxygenase (ABM) superfamily enzyme
MERDDHPITTVVTRDVMAGGEAEYKEWARDAASASARY